MKIIKHLLPNKTVQISFRFLPISFLPTIKEALTRVLFKFHHEVTFNIMNSKAGEVEPLYIGHLIFVQ